MTGESSFITTCAADSGAPPFGFDAPLVPYRELRALEQQDFANLAPQAKLLRCGASRLFECKSSGGVRSAWRTKAAVNENADSETRTEAPQGTVCITPA
jgi:hypothetical protein